MVKKRVIQFGVIAFTVIILDQLSKYIIYLSKPIISLGILKIQYITNTGAGFGILKGQTTFLGIISLLVAIGIILYYPKIPKDIVTQALGGIFLGGVIGNAIDRLVRGYVIDFVDFGWWPAFNVADAAITVAVIGIIILEIRKKDY